MTSWRSRYTAVLQTIPHTNYPGSFLPQKHGGNYTHKRGFAFDKQKKRKTWLPVYFSSVSRLLSQCPCPSFALSGCTNIPSRSQRPSPNRAGKTVNRLISSYYIRHSLRGLSGYALIGHCGPQNKKTFDFFFPRNCFFCPRNCSRTTSAFRSRLAHPDPTPTYLLYLKTRQQRSLAVQATRSYQALHNKFHGKLTVDQQTGGGAEITISSHIARKFPKRKKRKNYCTT